MARISRFLGNRHTESMMYAGDYNERSAVQLAELWPNDILMYIEDEFSVEYDGDRRTWFEENKDYIPEDLHEYLERWLDHTTAMEESI